MNRQRWTNGGILLSGLLLGVAFAAWKINPIPFLWLAALLVSGWAFRRLRRREFAADGSTFIVAASAADITTSAIFLSGSMGLAAHGLRDEPGTSHGMGFVALGAAAFWLILGLWEWCRPLTLTLGPGGVMVRTALWTHRISWDEITGPVIGKGQLLHLGGGYRMKFAVGSLTADPSFLAQAIEFYRQHPEHRPAIGTPEEHLRWT